MLTRAKVGNCYVNIWLGKEKIVWWKTLFLTSGGIFSEFRGTSESLKDLLNHDHQVKPLLLDIWQFYRAERLYLLQV